MLTRDPRFLAALGLIVLGAVAIAFSLRSEMRGEEGGWMIGAAGAIACVSGLRGALARRRRLKSE